MCDPLLGKRVGDGIRIMGIHGFYGMSDGVYPRRYGQAKWKSQSESGIVDDDLWSNLETFQRGLYAILCLSQYCCCLQVGSAIVTQDLQVGETSTSEPEYVVGITI